MALYSTLIVAILVVVVAYTLAYAVFSRTNVLPFETAALTTK
jgi:hypothetical protein